jgi:hypothetical protein
VKSLKEVEGSMAHLLGQHVALARAELSSDLRSLVSGTALLAVMAIPLVLGYALAMVALALLLAPLLGKAGGFGAVAGGNLLLGGLGLWFGVRNVKAVEVGDTTAAELRQSVSTLSGHVHAPAEERHVS